MADPTPYETAIHESGHAIVGILCGNTLTDVTIVADDGYLGLTRSWPEPPPEIVEHYLGTGDYESPTTMSDDWETITLADGREFPFTMGESEWTVEQEVLDAATLQSIQDYGARVQMFPTLGGPMAEQQVTGKWNAVGANNDMLSIGEWVEEYFGRHDDTFRPYDDDGVIQYDKVTEAARERWADDVNELLDRGWEWIEATAQALLEHNTLTGDEVEALRPADLT